MHPAIKRRYEQTAAATALGDIDGSSVSTDTIGDDGGHDQQGPLLVGCAAVDGMPADSSQTWSIDMCVGAGCMRSQS